MQAALEALEPGLASVLQAITECVASISAVLQRQDGDVTGLSGQTNQFGDTQLQVDVVVDRLIFERLDACASCCAASSEEQPEMRDLHQGNGYTVVFDPLDGSSIVGANFAVGSIFGVWPGRGVVGRTGREQAAAAYAVYGPRTLLVWARPAAGASGPLVVQQWVLGGPSGKSAWHLLPMGAAGGAASDGAASDPNINHVAGGGSLIAPTKRLFAPANLRCAATNGAYRRLVDAWVDRGFTLRYTGGMVPDVHHILAKGGGVFVNPTSAAAPAKLRLVYECAPLALVVEAAGGSSHDGRGSVLDARIASTGDRSPIVLGSHELVAESLDAMRAGLVVAD